VVEPVKVNRNRGLVWFIKNERQVHHALNDKNGNVDVNLLLDYYMVISGFLLTFFCLLIW
jgi:hypothetical protein